MGPHTVDGHDVTVARHTIHFAPIWDTTAGHVPGLARETTVVPHPLVIVRVVDPARLYGSTTPTERRVTLGTEHLVAPINLENDRGALGTRSRILGQELGRRHRVGIACMFHVLFRALDLVTLGAGPVFAEPTLPRGTQKAFAPAKRTRANELATVSRARGRSITVIYRNAVLIVRDFAFHNTDLLLNLEP